MSKTIGHGSGVPRVYRRSTIFIAIVLQVVSCSFISCANVLAQSGAAFPSEQEIEKELESSNVLGSHCEFRAKLDQENDLLHVSTPMVAGATDRDYKINAVLISKKAMTICGNKLAKVRVYFKGKDGSLITVPIHAGDVKAFGSRLESEDVLLASIDLIRKNANPNRSSAKLATIVEPNRGSILTALIKTRFEIASLASRNVEVSKFRDLADSVKATLEAGQLPEAASKLMDLDHQLIEQEEYCELQSGR